MCLLSQKLARGVPDDLTCTSPSFVCINFACVVHPLISGAGVYLASTAVTLKIHVALVKLRLLGLQRRWEQGFLILTSIQLITNNEVAASLQLQLQSVPAGACLGCLLSFTQVAQTTINKIHPVGGGNTTLKDVQSSSCSMSSIY